MNLNLNTYISNQFLLGAKLENPVKGRGYWGPLQEVAPHFFTRKLDLMDELTDLLYRDIYEERLVNKINSNYKTGR